MNHFEIAATVLGLIQGALIMFNKRCNWIFYVLQMIALVIFSFQSKLYGDVILNSAFVIFGIWAWFTWGKSRSNVTTTKGEWVWHTIGACVASAAVFYCLSITNDPLPLKDSITTIFGFLATLYMVQHKLETWVVWFFVDVLYVWQYAALPEPAWGLVVLNVIWSVMAIGSFIVWFKKK